MGENWRCVYLRPLPPSLPCLSAQQVASRFLFSPGSGLSSGQSCALCLVCREQLAPQQRIKRKWLPPHPTGEPPTPRDCPSFAPQRASSLPGSQPSRVPPLSPVLRAVPAQFSACGVVNQELLYLMAIELGWHQAGVPEYQVY